jgi:DNA uptake protein ComE-like DNA-binding protein
MLASISRALFVLALVPACAGSGSSDIEDGEHDNLPGKADDAYSTAEIKAILALVNDPAVSYQTLDDDVGLSKRAAMNIIEHRNGPDGDVGTADDDPFDSLAELDAVPYVGPATIAALLDYARNNGYLTVANRTLSVSWRVGELATSQNVGCPPGYDTIALTSQPVDAQDRPEGPAVVDLFDCAAGMHDSAPLPAGRYWVGISITDASGVVSYAKSTTAIVDLTQTNQSASFRIYKDGGYFALGWNLVGRTSNAALTCSQLPDLDSIEVVAIRSGTSTVVSDLFSCDAGSGLTAGLLGGDYMVSVSAVDMTAAALGRSEPMTRQVGELNRVTDLGPVTIPIDGH